MKKIFFVFCLTVFLGSYGFAQNNISLSLDNDSYEGNEKIVVTYSGVTQEMISAQAWIGISRSGEAASSYLDWKYVTQNSGQLEFTTPSESGSYEMRFYRGYTPDTDNFVQSAAVTFSVESSHTLPLNNDSYEINEKIIVIYSGVTGNMIMLRCTVSQNDYDNNAKVNIHPIFNLHLRAQEGEIVKTIETNGKTRYILEFRNASVSN